MSLKPLILTWTEPAPPDEHIRYDHVVAQTPLGRISIEWKSWKPFDSFDIQGVTEGYWGYGNNLEDAKRIAQEKWNELILSCLSEQPDEGQNEN